MSDLVKLAYDRDEVSSSEEEDGDTGNSSDRTATDFTGTDDAESEGPEETSSGDKAAMPDLVKLAYDRAEVSSSEEDGDTENSSDHTATDSTGTDDTESEESEETSSKKELEIVKSGDRHLTKSSVAESCFTPTTEILASPGMSDVPEQTTNKTVTKSSQEVHRATKQEDAKMLGQIAAKPLISNEDSITLTPKLKDELLSDETELKPKEMRCEYKIPATRDLSKELMIPTPEKSEALQKECNQPEGYTCRIAERTRGLPIIRSAISLFSTVEHTPCIAWLAFVMRLQYRASLACVNPLLSFCFYRCGPFASKADSALCFGLDLAERVCPCLKMTSKQMLCATNNCILNCICCLPRTACCLSGLCRRKSKEE